MENEKERTAERMEANEPFHYQMHQKPVRTPRIDHLYQVVGASKVGMCMERGRIITEVYQQNRALTPIQLRAVALKEILNRMSIYLLPGSLLAGNQASRPNYAPLFPEYAVDFLEEMDVPAYKIASFEITDIPLIRKVARLGKPVILATGIARLADIELAVQTCREEGNHQVILLKCCSAYPTPYEDVNLRTIPHMAEAFDCLTGLSDHTMGTAVASGAVALGARMVEKHMTLRRSDGGPDAAFSMEPQEFREMVDNIRILEKALGKVSYDLSDKQVREREHSRSLFVARDMKAGEVFTPENLRSVRPADGLHTRYYEQLLGRRITRDAGLGTPMSWDLVGD